MKIVKHQLVKPDGTPYPFRASPNVGGKLEARYLVMHFTAGSSAQESIDWLVNPKAKASAHVVIGRDGKITQLVPFNKVAWHAGASRWEGIEGLNRHSIGIELDNAGRLVRKGGKWQAWFGGSFKDADVMEAVHKNESTSSGWHVYTPEQIEAAAELAALLVDQYDLQDVIGHDDISPGRKFDPGPAFPMGNFRSRALGGAAERLPVFVTTDSLNIRVGPGAGHKALDEGPLPPGTRVEVLAEDGNWRRVDVLDTVGGANDLEGWVNGRFLRRAEVDASPAATDRRAPLVVEVVPPAQ